MFPVKSRLPPRECDLTWENVGCRSALSGSLMLVLLAKGGGTAKSSDQGAGLHGCAVRTRVILASDARPPCSWKNRPAPSLLACFYDFAEVEPVYSGPGALKGGSQRRIRVGLTTVRPATCHCGVQLVLGEQRRSVFVEDPYGHGSLREAVGGRLRLVVPTIKSDLFGSNFEKRQVLPELKCFVWRQAVAPHERVRHVVGG